MWQCRRNPCKELLGNVATECAACDSSARCHPGVFNATTGKSVRRADPSCDSEAMQALAGPSQCEMGRCYEHSQSKCQATVPTSWLQSPLGPLFVFISHEKVGSNSLLHALRELASRQHEANASLSYRCIAQHDWHNAFETPLCYRHYLPRGCCEAAPSGTIVHDNRFGFCGGVRGRPCAYATVLREPFARVVSAYNYMCVSCADGIVHCPERAASSGGSSGHASFDCPHINLTTFVAVHMVGSRGKNWPPTYVKQLGAGVPEAVDRLQVARERLRQMVAVPLEHLSSSRGRGESAWRRLAAFVTSETQLSSRSYNGLTSSMNEISHVQRGSRAAPLDALRTVQSLSAPERDELSRLLADDLVLYRDVIRMSRERENDREHQMNYEGH